MVLPKEPVPPVIRIGDFVLLKSRFQTLVARSRSDGNLQVVCCISSGKATLEAMTGHYFDCFSTRCVPHGRIVRQPVWTDVDFRPVVAGPVRRHEPRRPTLLIPRPVARSASRKSGRTIKACSWR